MTSDLHAPRGGLWSALKAQKPLQIVGVINAYCALLAKDAGFKAIYLSGGGVANASYGLPDLGLTSLSNVVEDVRRITANIALPLLVDADTGWKSVADTTCQLIDAGAAGMHLEDQIAAKRCGHRPGKQLVTIQQMADKIKRAVKARGDCDFVIMARTDAVAVEGMDAAVERACQYAACGADMIFAEALGELDEYKRFVEAVEVPVLANLTEFGQTPLLTLDQMRDVGVAMVLYPLSAFRAMNAAAQRVYQTIYEQGTQQEVLPLMQTREELYRLLDYHTHEQKLDHIPTREQP